MMEGTGSVDPIQEVMSTAWFYVYVKHQAAQLYSQLKNCSKYQRKLSLELSHSNTYQLNTVSMVIPIFKRGKYIFFIWWRVNQISLPAITPRFLDLFWCLSENHRLPKLEIWASELLGNIRNIRICMEKRKINSILEHELPLKSSQRCTKRRRHPF